VPEATRRDRKDRKKGRHKAGKGGDASAGDGARSDAPPRVRPFWSGTIAFGLVSLPVGLYVAHRRGGVSLKMVDDDGTQLKRQYICPAEDKPLTSDEIVRGYEVAKGEFVVVTDEELDALQPEKSQEIDLRRFVDRDEIDPVFFERAYFLAPDRGASKAYRLLVHAMADANRAGIATFVMRGKEYLVAILSDDGLLRAETMRFSEEIRTPEMVGLPEVGEADAERISAMEQAMDDLSADELDRSLLHDDRDARILALVERKLEEGVDVVERPTEGEEDEDQAPVDLMAMLKARLQQGSGDGDGDGANGPSGDGSLMDRTKSELYEQAQDLDISGRSSMSKAQLADAIRSARP
jgi:DNA end-binding protein Ku